jgi:hypothetical protein
LKWWKPGTCEKNDEHGSEAAVQDWGLYKEGDAEVGIKQKELKRVERAGRNAME